MKNSLFTIGMLFFVLVFSLTIFGCGNDNPTEDDPTDDQIDNPIDRPKPVPDYDPSEDTSLDLIPNVLEGVTSDSSWFNERREEIKVMMQDEYYGQWRSGETVTYTISGNTLTVKVSHGGKEVQFNATVQLPETTPPAGGYPVIMAFGGLGGTLNTTQYSLDKGYANISLPTNTVASDNANREGVFYTLYPWSTQPRSQTGVLMAWAWGASKVLDALEAGAAAELNIDAAKTIITGTSRNGKAAAVAGAFEERFKITVPVSSGAGGCAIYRYASNGQTYDLREYFSYKNDGNGGDSDGRWTVDANNPQSLSNVQGDSSGGWFNAKFRTYTMANLPFDQHFLLSLCADYDRYLFMVNGFTGDKWTNPPGFFYAFQLTYEVYKLLGIPQNIAVSMHLDQHGFEQEDMVKLIKYANYMFYGTRDLTFDYALEDKPKPATWKDFMEDLHKTPFSAIISPANNEIYQTGKPR